MLAFLNFSQSKGESCPLSVQKRHPKFLSVGTIELIINIIIFLTTLRIIIALIAIRLFLWVRGNRQAMFDPNTSGRPLNEAAPQFWLPENNFVTYPL